MNEMIKMGRPDKYEEYYEWLDEYNSDQTQPPETPSAAELQAQFPELGGFEAVQIIMCYMERIEKQLKGG